MIEQYRKLIDAAVKADTKKLDSYEDFVESTTGDSRSLKTFINSRRTYLLP